MQNFEVRNKNCWASSVGDSLFANILGLFIRFAIISLTTGKTVDNGKDSWQWENLWTMGATIRQQGKTCWRLERQRTIGETMDIGKDHGHSGKTEWQSERRLAAGKTATLVSWKKHQRKIYRNGLEPLALKKVARGWILNAETFTPSDRGLRLLLRNKKRDEQASDDELTPAKPKSMNKTETIAKLRII